MNEIGNNRKIDTEYIKNHFIFCQKGWSLFENEFYVEKKTLLECSQCKEKVNINNYIDMFICFNCKNKVTWNSHEYELKMNNGYLCRIHKQTNKIGYFHRFLKAIQIKDLAEMKKLSLNEIEVHHINEHIKDNRLSNLAVMTHEDHVHHHGEIGLQRKYDSAFDTFCDKAYDGNVPYDAEERFNEWLEKKEGERYSW
jgi:Zn finger protein HypA/HybF involved in hydrogenase expression